MLFIGEGKHHQVYLQDDEYVVKIPQKNTNITYEQAKKSLHFFQAEFGKYIPETSIFPGENGLPYRVIQRRVNGLLLGDFLQSYGMSQELCKTLLSFTEKALHILERKIIGFDIIGTPPNEELKGQWDGCTNIIINPEDENMSFIDCVIPSRAFGRSLSINRLMQLVRYPVYKRRRNHYFCLMQDLQMRSVK